MHAFFKMIGFLFSVLTGFFQFRKAPYGLGTGAIRRGAVPGVVGLALVLGACGGTPTASSQPAASSEAPAQPAAPALPALSPQATSSEAPAQPVASSEVPAQPAASPAPEPYYTGDGGKAITLVVYEPVGRGLKDESILHAVQSLFYTCIGKYSAITLVDWQHLDEIKAQQEESTRPIYSEEDYISLTQGVNARYMLVGTISRTPNEESLTLDFGVSTVERQTREASYGPVQCPPTALAGKVADGAARLLEQLGVRLTAAGRAALTAQAGESWDAMVALGRSSIAPTAFEKAYYTYEAAKLDPTLQEAAHRLSAYQTGLFTVPEVHLTAPAITVPEIRVPEIRMPEFKPADTGNLRVDALKQQEQYTAQVEISKNRQASGAKALADLQGAVAAQFQAQQKAVQEQQAELLRQRDVLRGQQKTLLADQRSLIAQLHATENSYGTFFMEHPPFEIIYDPAVEQAAAHLREGTRDLQFRVSSVGTTAMEVIPAMLGDFQKGLETMRRGFEEINRGFDTIEARMAQVEAGGRGASAQLVRDYGVQVTKMEAAEREYAAQLAKMDAAGGTNDYRALAAEYAIQPDRGYAERLAPAYGVQPTGYAAAGDKTLGDSWTLTTWNKDETRTFVIEAALSNAGGGVISRASVSLTNRILAAAYTKPLSAGGLCVFAGVPVTDITDVLKVTIETVDGVRVAGEGNGGYIRISALEADGYTREGYDIGGYNRNGFDKLGYDSAGYDKDGLNRWLIDRKGYVSDGSAADRARYTAQGYDRAGYDRGGYDRDGYDKDGLSRVLTDRKGYLSDGSAADRARYTAQGYDRAGYDRAGYDRGGYNRNGKDRNGNYKPYRIGDTGPAGGLIFYDKGNAFDGWRYQEAAPADLPGTYQWGGAARACADYVYGGYDDWVLPSKGMLNLMYTNLKKKGLGGFKDDWYWSSSQYLSNTAWVQSFSSGIRNDSYERNTHCVRSVRAF